MRDGFFTKLLQFCFAIILPFISTSATGFASDGDPGWEGLRSQALNASERGSYKNAEELFRSALSSLPDPASCGAVILWNEIGESQQAQSRVADAEQAYRRSMDINRKLQQPDDYEMAVSLNDLAAISHAHSQFASAESLLQEAYLLLEKNPGSANAIAGSVL